VIGYVEEADFLTYCSARGIVLALPEDQTLTLALDYLELQNWAGEKTDPDQPLDWPRNGATEVPADIKQAQMEAAIVYDGGGDPMAPVGPKVLSETVFGAVAVTYSDKGGNSGTYYTKLMALIQPYLETSGYGATQFAVKRS